MAKHGHKGGKSFTSKFLQHPGSLVKPLTGKRMRKELKSARRLEFGPESRQLHAEQRAAAQEQRRIPGWFNDYTQTLAKMQAQSAGGYNQAEQAIQGQTQQASDYAEQLRQRMRAENEQSAASRGATYDPSLDATAQQAILARQQLSQNTEGALAQQGAAQNAYFADKRRIGKGEELNQMLKASARGRSVNADLRDLAGRERAFTKDYQSQARPQERDFYLGLLQAKLGNKANKLSARTSRSNAALSARQSNINSKRSARSSRASTRVSAGNLRERRRHDRQTEKNARHSGSGSSGGKRIDHNHVAHMVAVLNTADHKHQRHARHNRQWAISALLDKSTTYTPKEAKRAYAKWLKHHRPHGHKGNSSPNAALHGG